MERIPFQLQLRRDLSVPELGALTLYSGIFGVRTLKKNGIEYLYASLDKHPYVRSVVTP